MEDYSRDLEKELIKYSVPNPFKQSRNWQLLFVSDDGKTISVKKYKGLVLTVFLALILAILFSGVLSVLYYKSYKEKKSLRLSLTEMTQAFQKAHEEKELLNARVFFLNKREKLIKKPAAAKKGSAVKKKVKKQASPADAKRETMRVVVENLSMKKNENSKLTKIRFLIRNLSRLKRISGRVFVVLKPDSLNQQNWLTLPPVLLKDSEPSIFEKGRFFSINNFKSMNFKFNDTLENPYKTLTIFIYSKTGEKVFESSYPVKIKLIKKPDTKKKEVITKKTSAQPPPAEVKKELAEKNVASETRGDVKKTFVKKADNKLEKKETQAKPETTSETTSETKDTNDDKPEVSQILSGEGTLKNAD